MAGRTINLTIAGEGFLHDRVPVTVLAAKLEALQNLVYHAAATIRRDKTARRGPWINRYRQIAELTFVCSHHSQLAVEAELPEAEVLSPDFDTGQQALDLIFKAGEACEQSPDSLLQLLPDIQDRTFILRSLEGLCPSPLEGYRVSLENGSQQHPTMILTGEIRQKIRQRISDAITTVYEDREPETLVGVLTKIHVEVAPLKIAIQLSSGMEIDCYYEESLRDQITNLLAGSTVEVTGVVSRDMNERIKQIDRILDIDTVGTEPLRLNRIGRVTLKFPVLFNVEYLDGLWLYRNEELNLWGRGNRREKALEDLGDNFDYLWREIAQEKDEHLEKKAIEIKKKLLTLVGETHAG
ncbi:MAG: hypothetical protein WC975_01205 [Phycisphaerae bacterium]